MRCNDDVVVLPLSTQRLVAFLALQGRPLRRVHVAGTLWINASEEHANACLRTALWRLRQLSPRMVTATSTHLEFSNVVAVDVRRAVTHATEILQGRHSGNTALLALSEAGELLPDWYDDWVLIERERMRQHVIHALERLCAEATAGGRFADAAEAGLAAVAQEPLRESAHRLVVEAHLANGNLVDAIRQYHLYSRLLARHLGLKPSPQMNALVNGLAVTSVPSR